MHTKNFSQLYKTDAATAGGKGASLGEMLQAGIPVPDGFVVLAPTFDGFLAETDLIQEIEASLATVDTKSIHTVEAASARIQELIRQTAMPASITKEVLAEFHKLNSTYVAVRSSATAEDGADHAWAGQLSSYLNTTEDTLLERVQDCWASLFTPRAIFYRFEKGLHDTQISVAVVIQKMVNSEKSGVAFSVHPVTEDFNQVIIEAGLGLGEAIVSGAVTPDSYVVTKEPREIIDTNVNDQKKALYRSDAPSEEGYNEWRQLTTAEANSQVLQEKEIMDLTNIILTIEDHYGFPCDIEWAYEAGTFYIVQSRPITTLNEKLANLVVWKKLWSRNFGIQFSYAPMLGFGIADILPHPLHNVLVVPEKNMESMYVPEEEFKVLHLMIDKEYVQNFERLQLFIENFFSSAENFVSEAMGLGKGVSACTNTELGKRLDLFLARFSHYGGYLWVTFYINELMNEKVSAVIQSCPLSERDKEQLLEYAVSPSDPASIMLLAHSAEHKKIEDLIKDFDWLTTFDVHNEIATEDDIRERMMGTTNTLPLNAPDAFGLVAQEIKDTILFSRQMTYLKDVRDDFRRKAIRSILPLYDAIGERVGLTRKTLSFLTKEEIILLLEGEGEVAELQKHAQLRSDNGFALFLKDDKIIVKDQSNEIETLIKTLEVTIDQLAIAALSEFSGVTGQKGKVRGRVVVVNGIKELDKVTEGCVLCTVTTNPDYLPAMRKSIAFVTDEGGITCHAAIVSRELKKPCIVGTKNATTFLSDGDLVEVDADFGVVRILERAAKD